MSCLICAQATILQRVIGDWEERNCISCGHYRISKNLLIFMELQGFKFNISETKIWLSKIRMSDPIPSIVTDNAIYDRLGAVK